MFIDTHCHISSDYYDNIDEVIQGDIDALIDKIIISGCEKKEIQSTIEYINKYDILYGTIGYHPQEVNNVSDGDIKDLEKIIKSNNKIVGIGEIGLDYHYGKDNILEQKNLFEKQLILAEKLGLPVVIHSRDATKDTIDILKKFNVTGVIHCFSGSLETANVYISMGYKLGIGGVVTFKNSNLFEVIDGIDLSNVVLETDSPYLTPEPFRGMKNSSKYIPIIAQKIANIKGISLEEVSRITLENTHNVFDLN